MKTILFSERKILVMQITLLEISFFATAGKRSIFVENVISNACEKKQLYESIL
jgi:hypothetical protein